MYPSSPDICYRDSTLWAKLSLCCSQATPNVSPLQAVRLPPNLPTVTASSLDSHNSRAHPRSTASSAQRTPMVLLAKTTTGQCFPQQWQVVAQAMTKLPPEKLCEGRSSAEGHLGSKDISLIPHSVKSGGTSTHLVQIPPCSFILVLQNTAEDRYVVSSHPPKYFTPLP